ncbi:hypothetical protein GCM10022226_83070 [Sphaerisporangium flaviroseum]|uniref:Uncharacterized protein n=1 Tax=Sphaerisporangium flaviroseum TaxID=509199 RepID=A0ABP7JLC8_9ACTN
MRLSRSARHRSWTCSAAPRPSPKRLPMALHLTAGNVVDRSAFEAVPAKLRLRGADRDGHAPAPTA